jgi:HEAT repeat protein
VGRDLLGRQLGSSEKWGIAAEEIKHSKGRRWMVNFFSLFKPNVARLQRKRDVTSLIAALVHEDPRIRRAALSALGEIGDVCAVEPLIQRLSRRTKWTMDLARSDATALGRIGDTRALEPLIAALKDPDAELRQAAAEALGIIGDARAVESLLAVLSYSSNALGRDEARVSKSALSAIRAIGKPGVEFLLSALKNPDSRMRLAAATALDTIGVFPNPSNQAWYAVARERWNDAVVMGADAVQPLMCALKSSDSYEVRKAAAEALGMVNALCAVDMLGAAFFEDPNLSVSTAAATALGKIGDVSAVGLLAKEMGGSDPLRVEMRRAAVKALGAIRAPRAVDALVAVLQNSHSDVRLVAIETLGEIRSPRAVDALVEALKDSNAGIRKGAILTLIATGRPAVEAAMEELLTLIKQGERSACIALETYGLIPDDPQFQAWYVVANMEWDKAVAMGPVAMEPLIAQLKRSEEDEFTKSNAAWALGRIGDARALESLIAALKDSTRPVRDSAAAALGVMGDLRAVEPVITALLYSRPSLRDQWSCGAESLSNLFGDYTKLIKDAFGGVAAKRDNSYLDCPVYFDDRVKQEAVNALCKLNTPVSSNILYKISMLPDMLEMNSNDTAVSFHSIREQARMELKKRGSPEYDSTVYLTTRAWKIGDDDVSTRDL